jgi:hypothetical protein
MARLQHSLLGSKLQNQMEHSFKVLTFNRSLCFLKTIALLGGMVIYELDWPLNCRCWFILLPEEAGELCWGSSIASIKTEIHPFKSGNFLVARSTYLHMMEM